MTAAADPRTTGIPPQPGSPDAVTAAAPAVVPVPDAAVRVVHVTKTYGEGAGEVRALDDVTVDLERGRFTAVMGPSGSGKSTLMHVSAGLDTATSGSVLLGGTDLTTLKDKELRALRRDRSSTCCRP